MQSLAVHLICTVSISVTASNRAPVTVDDSYPAKASAALIITAPDLLSNDTDADSDPLMAVKVTNPAHGTLTLNANGSFTYVPASGYVGSDSFTYKANDGKADSNIAIVTLTVKYNFTGFFQPVDNAPVENQMKAGSSVPIKFSLGSNMGLNIFASGYPILKQIACPGSEPVDEIEQTTTSKSGLTYDSVTGQYIYTWKTDKKLANTCQQLTLRLTDGTDHIILFKFK